MKITKTDYIIIWCLIPFILFILMVATINYFESKRNTNQVVIAKSSSFIAVDELSKTPIFIDIGENQTCFDQLDDYDKFYSRYAIRNSLPIQPWYIDDPVRAAEFNSGLNFKCEQIQEDPPKVYCEDVYYTTPLAWETNENCDRFKTKKKDRKGYMK